MKTYHIIFRRTEDTLQTGENFEVLAEQNEAAALNKFRVKYPDALFLVMYSVNTATGGLRYD